MSLLVFQSYRKVYSILPKPFRIKAILVITAIILNSFLELAGLAAIVPVISIMLEENAIQNSELLTWLYNFFGFKSDKPLIVVIAFALLGVIILKNIAGLLISKYNTQYIFSINKYLSVSIYEKLYSLGYSYFKSINSHEMIKDISSIPTYFSSGVVLPLLNLFNEVLVLVLIVIGLIIYDIKIVFLLAIVVIPFFLIFYTSAKERITKITEELIELAPKVSRILYQSIFGYADTKITNTEKTFFKRYSTILDKQIQLRVKDAIYKLAPSKIIEISMFLGILSVLIYGVYFFDSRDKIITLIGIFAISAYRIMPSINRIMIALLSIKSQQISIAIIEKSYGITLPSELEAQIINFNHSIEIKDIHFSYSEEGSKILNGISFTVLKGETIGIIGESGSGKTTILNILLRFLIQNSGEIIIDGTTIEPNHIKSWRDKIGYVPQELFIIEGSLEENIAFGISSNEIDYSLVNEVISKSSLSEVVKNLPLGVKTHIGENGSKLSGGQKQRLAIARALYSGAELLFFDEATSALDNETEQEVTEAINNLSNHNLTIIIIAHRYSTLKHCNKIVELKNGEVNNISTYEQLKKKII